jgi:hypothetical protein
VPNTPPPTQMADVALRFPRPGPRLPYGNKARYLNAYTRGWDETAFAQFIEELRRFAAGEPNDKGAAIKLATAADRLLRVGSVLHHRTVHAALQNDPAWRQALDRSAAYNFLGHQLDACRWLYASIAVRGKEGDWLDFSGTLNNIAHCLMAGWTERAAGQTHLLLRALKWNYVIGNAHKARTQFFVMRLLADWQGVPDYLRQWPKWARDEPLFARLLEIWRTPNATAELGHLLLVACDRRTHQSSSSDKRHYDLKHIWQWYDPFEIVALMKLRALAGLELPTLDHPILDSPLGHIPEPSVPYDDELLAAIRARVRTLHPDAGPDCCASAGGAH